MNIRWSGTGSAWSTRFGNSSAVLEAEGARLMIDCGHTVPSRLPQMNLSLREIDAVFISHLHGDHVYGLEEWGFRSLLQWHKRPHLLIPETLALPLWRNVLMGTMAQACERDCLLRSYFQVTTLKVGEPTTLGPYTLEIHPVRHVPRAHCYGVRIRAEGRHIGFTCDTLADADPWFYEDTEAVFHDCNFLPYYDGTVHSHFEQLREYPATFRERTWLVHYDDSVWKKQHDPEWQAELAKAGLRLTPPFIPL